MSYFTSFITSLCAACIMIGALHMICPDGAMGKSVKYILSLIFIVSVIAAASFNIQNFDWNTDYAVPEIQSDESLQSASARYVYSAALKSAGINFREITVCTDKSESGSIIISKVIIYSDCDAAKIRVALGAVAENLEVEIINE